MRIHLCMASTERQVLVHETTTAFVTLLSCSLMLLMASRAFSLFYTSAMCVAYVFILVFVNDCF